MAGEEVDGPDSSPLSSHFAEPDVEILIKTSIWLARQLLFNQSHQTFSRREQVARKDWPVSPAGKPCLLKAGSVPSYALVRFRGFVVERNADCATRAAGTAGRL
jgi:hypothetical protein